MLEVDERHAELARERLGNLLLGDEPQLDHDAPKPATGFFLRGERVLQLLLGEQLLLH
ncbi:hypothetical protein D3C83_90750 [compost metagenome]